MTNPLSCDSPYLAEAEAVRSRRFVLANLSSGHPVGRHDR
jgi:hypothetical protein